MDKKIYFAAAAAAALFVLTREKPKTTAEIIKDRLDNIKPPELPEVLPDRAPPETNGNTPLTNAVLSGNDILEQDLPPRLFWVYLFNQLLNQNNFDIELTISDLWDSWNVQQNMFLKMLPTKTALFLDLSSYVPNRNTDNAQISQPQMITWDSAPIYETLTNMWNGVSVWTCAEWKNYHIALEQHYQDTYKANNVWLLAWNNSDNQCSALYIYCPLTTYCNLDCDFVEYLYSKDIDVSNLFSTAYCGLTNITKNIIKAGVAVVQTGANVVQTVSNVSEGVKNTSSLFSVVLPIGFVVGGIYYVTR